MKLQRASQRELKRITVGSLICLGLMLGAFWTLGKLNHRVVIGGLLGTGVALCNFAALCLTIQYAALIENAKQRQARLQLSYNARLIAQAAWVVAAFLLPWLQPVAAAIPLLFPAAVIFVLRCSRSRRKE